MRIKTIVVPTDFSSNAQLAFKVAYELARDTKATLYVVHVAESSLRTAVKENLIRPGISTPEIREAVEELTDSRFAEMTAGLDADIPVCCEVRHGNPHVAIIDFVRDTNADLVVVGLRGRSPFNAARAALMGSVAEALVRKSPCPVLVVRPDHEGVTKPCDGYELTASAGD